MYQRIRDNRRINIKKIAPELRINHGKKQCKERTNIKHFNLLDQENCGSLDQLHWKIRSLANK